MAKVTQLLLDLEWAGYTPVFYALGGLYGENVDKRIMYMNNTDVNVKTFNIAMGAANDISAVYESSQYNTLMTLTDGRFMSGELADGNAANVVAQGPDLVGIQRITYPNARQNIYSTVVWYKYWAGMWSQIQDGKALCNIIDKSEGFRGIIKMRVQIPRLTSAASKLFMSMTGALYYTDTARFTDHTKEQVFDLIDDDLLAGYKDVEFDTGVYLDEHPARTLEWDRFASINGNYEANKFVGSITASVANKELTLFSNDIAIPFHIYFARPMEVATLNSTDNVNLFVSSRYMGNNTVRFGSSADPSHLQVVAGGFKGTINDGEIDTVGVFKGKRYVELMMNSLDPNACMGLVRKVYTSADPSNPVYLNVLTVKPGAVYVNDTRVFEDASIVFDLATVYRFAVDFKTQELYFGMNDKWWSSGSWVTVDQSQFENGVSAIGYVPFDPDYGGATPLTYSLSVGSNPATVHDGTITLSAFRNDLEYSYSKPTTEYQDF